MVFALVVLAVIMAGSWLPSRIIVATSDSLDHRVFLKVSVDPGVIEEGDYLLFRLPGHEHKKHIDRGLKENDVLIKQVACKPGELLQKSSGGTFICSGRVIGEAMEKDSMGHALPEFQVSGLIPPGYYFMMGTNPRSYDSRYFGLIHVDDFISKALPLW